MRLYWIVVTAWMMRNPYVRALCNPTSPKRRHVKPDLRRAITVLPPDRTGVARPTAGGHAALSARICCQVGAAGFDIEAARTERSDRTGFQARPACATVARMDRGSGRSFVRRAGVGGSRLRERRRFKQDCPAIAVPETEFGVDQQTQRRWLEPFRRHRPLLKRMPRPVRGKRRLPAKQDRNRTDHRFRPVIQRFCRVWMRLPPGFEYRPEATAAMADKADSGRGPSIAERRRKSGLRRQPSAGHKPAWRESPRNGSGQTRVTHRSARP